MLKEKEKLKTGDYRDFIGGRHLNGSSHAMKVKIPGNYSRTVSARLMLMVLKMRISVNSWGKVSANNDFQGLKIPFVSRKYLQM